MFTQIMKLDEIRQSLWHVKANMHVTCDYFSEGKPDPYKLVTRYEMHGLINAQALVTVSEQIESLGKAIDELMEIGKSLRDVVK
jgi:Zn-dependent alcohol dehydrogenase